MIIWVSHLSPGFANHKFVAANQARWLLIVRRNCLRFAGAVVTLVNESLLLRSIIFFEILIGCDHIWKNSSFDPSRLALNICTFAISLRWRIYIQYSTYYLSFTLWAAWNRSWPRSVRINVSLQLSYLSVRPRAMRITTMMYVIYIQYLYVDDISLATMILKENNSRSSSCEDRTRESFFDWISFCISRLEARRLVNRNRHFLYHDLLRRGQARTDRGVLYCTRYILKLTNGLPRLLPKI